MEITNETLVSSRISKNFTIELDNGKEITINKWSQEGEHEATDGDWDFVDGKDIYDKLKEEEQDEVWDFINEISLYN